MLDYCIPVSDYNVQFMYYRMLCQWNILLLATVYSTGSTVLLG